MGEGGVGLDEVEAVDDVVAGQGKVHRTVAEEKIDLSEDVVPTLFRVLGGKSIKNPNKIVKKIFIFIYFYYFIFIIFIYLFLFLI